MLEHNKAGRGETTQQNDLELLMLQARSRYSRRLVSVNLRVINCCCLPVMLRACRQRTETVVALQECVLLTITFKVSPNR